MPISSKAYSERRSSQERKRIEKKHKRRRNTSRGRSSLSSRERTNPWFCPWYSDNWRSRARYLGAFESNNLDELPPYLPFTESQSDNRIHVTEFQIACLRYHGLLEHSGLHVTDFHRGDPDSDGSTSSEPTTERRSRSASWQHNSAQHQIRDSSPRSFFSVLLF